MQRVRIPSNRGTSSAIADIDEEGRDSGGASAAATRGRAITLAVRKGLIQNSIPIGYLKELEKSDCAALHNNLVVMMADFCVWYTALVDW
nr:hypothetical protein CFP56_65623 [Quercus suber]